MESHRFLSLISLILMGFLHSSQAVNYYVGGNDGWVLNPSDNFNSWAQRSRFSVSDSLVFKYKQGSDSVLVVSKEDYDKCNTANPIKKFEDGNSVFSFDRSGPFFFISGNPGSCEKGQKLTVVVLSVRSVTPVSPSPKASTPSPKASPPVVSPKTPVSPSPKASPPAQSSSPNASSPVSTTPPAVSPTVSLSPKASPPVSNPPTVSPVSQSPKAAASAPAPALSPKSSSPVPSPSASSPSASLSPAGSSPSPAADTPESSSDVTAPVPAPDSSSPSSSPVLTSSIVFVLGSVILGSFVGFF